MKNENLHRLAVRTASYGSLACVALLAAGRAAQAQSTQNQSTQNQSSQNLLIAGGQGSSNAQFAYLGMIAPIAGGTLGHGPFVVPFFGWSRYTFNQNGTEFTGSEPSGSLGFGYAWTTNVLSVSLSIAGGYSNTTLSPYAPPGAFKGSQWFAEPQMYAQLKLPAGVTVTGDGGYLTGLRSYFVTSYAQVPVTDAVAVGPEADFGGGINYRNQTFGLRVSDRVTPGLTVALTGGAQTNIPGNYRPYFALALSVPIP